MSHRISFLSRNSSLVVAIAMIGVGILSFAAFGVFSVFANRPLVQTVLGEEITDTDELGLVDLGQFTVNLVSDGEPHTLSVGVILVFPDKETEMKMGANKVRRSYTRAAIVKVLKKKKAGDLQTVEGMETLEREAAANAALTSGLPIKDVVFSDFYIRY